MTAIDEVALPAPARAALEEVVGRALGKEHVEVVDWSIQKVPGGLDRSSTVYRATGTANVGKGLQEWSVFLKVFQPLPGREDPASAFYWRREPEAFASGILDQLAEGLVGPRLLGTEDHGTEVWLWLEHVGGVPGTEWTLDQALAAVRKLGTFSGAYLAGRQLPSEPWILRDLRHAWAVEAAPGIARLAAMRDHPLVRIGWSDGLDEVVLRFWEDDRPRFLEALGRLPRTLQHGDPNPLNMFVRPVASGGNGRAGGVEQTVVIDWAFLCITPLGEDLATLASYAAAWGRGKPGIDAQATTALIIETYTEGLRENGWRGDAQLVRLGYHLTKALRYLLHPFVLELLDEVDHTRAEQKFGKPVKEILQSVPNILQRGLAAAGEARRMMGQR
ncbi:MAG: aminoglycoside phosphotransferase family protein [Candidatus Latescibacteria bacterium]|nr:aminoglycoside phosphotransferase family protein [Candidatus Latescibacterota bacterium]